MKKIKYILAAVLLASGFSSCESFLDEQPVSELPADQMWTSSREAKAGVSQIYGFFRSAMRENYFYWGEFRSDDFLSGASTAADQQRVLQSVLLLQQCGRFGPSLTSTRIVAVIPDIPFVKA